jgi:predicted XRE-type DNA-binding protein
MEITPQWKRRFNAKWTRDESTGCWIWHGAHVPRGYGIIKIPGERKQEYAHRLSWLIHRGPIPEGQYVLHQCDTPACVNPEHLFLGSAKANAGDMKNKGRHLYGELNHTAVLTAPDVVKIKKLLSTGMFSQAEIGRMFGVHQITISKIHRGLRWAHITIPEDRNEQDPSP